MINGRKVIVVLPAYNAEKTLERTLAEIPREFADEILLVDDHSADHTAELGKRLGLTVFPHDKNQGYGANQKTCYREALKRGADVIVMLHPDYQYDPRLILAMAAPICYGVYDVMLGSRILGGMALKGGMPLYKYVLNRALTFLQNLAFGRKLSEYHTGYRAFHRKVLEAVPFEKNSDDFVFDAEILAQIIEKHYAIGEVSCPTRYFPEASSIRGWPGIRYAWGCLRIAFCYAISHGIKRLAKMTNTLKNCLFSLMMLGIASFIIEGGLRLGALFDRNNINIIEQQICQYDSFLGWKGRPLHPDNLFSQGGGYYLNSLGFRDREYAVEKPQDKRRIIILGDSFVWGYNVSSEQSFPKVLERLLGDSYEVLNWGIPGYSTDQELLLLERYGLAFKPDAVILSIFLDDIFNNGGIAIHNGRYPKPRFVKDGQSQLRLQNVPVPYLESPLHIIQAIQRAQYTIRSIGEHQGHFDADWPRLVLSPDYAESSDWDITLRILDRLQSVCKEADIQLWVIMIPIKEQFKKGQGRAPQSKLQSYAQGKKDFSYIEIMPELNLGDYWEADLHWNSAGHIKVARILSESVHLGSSKSN